MITINQNTGNTVSLTLNEKATVTPYNVLFEFKNDTTGLIKYFSALDTSPATDRYNLFQITENATESLTVGTVSLLETGYWSYNIYQMPYSGTVSLDPSVSIKVLEIGKALVIGTASIDSVFTLDENINNVTFE